MSTLDDLNARYARLAADLGDRVYRIGLLQAECDELRKQMLTLNQEAANLPEKEATHGS